MRYRQAAAAGPPGLPRTDGRRPRPDPVRLLISSRDRWSRTIQNAAAVWIVIPADRPSLCFTSALETLEIHPIGRPANPVVMPQDQAPQRKGAPGQPDSHVWHARPQGACGGNQNGYPQYSRTHVKRPPTPRRHRHAGSTFNSDSAARSAASVTSLRRAISSTSDVT
jgi:hypothetical protein